MKQRIHSKGNGWYIFATNFKDEKDYTFMNLYFPRNTEPEYRPDDTGKCVKDIDIQEAKMNCYKGKIGMTIFKYEEITEDSSMMGGRNAQSAKSIDIQPEDLPFF